MKPVISLALVLTLAPTTLLAADEFEPRNRIDVHVTAKVSYKSKENTFTYRYTVANGKDAKQSVWRLRVSMPDEGLAGEISRPDGWFKPRYTPKGMGWNPALRSLAFVSWASQPPFHIAPGQKEKGFSFNSTASLPGIVDYYVEGYAPPPKFPPGGAPDGPIPGYDDLTPYGPGVVGRTIGPVKPPAPLIPAVFVDYLIGMVEEATRLGWIRDKETRHSLLVDLKEAKAALLRGDIKAARKKLKDALDGVRVGEHGEEDGRKEKDKDNRGGEDKESSSEGAALLRYNLRYLIAGLQSPDKD
ncbi:MAG TPA: hypothetical protein VJ396_07685 [Acidiferrobacterales bacterium]|nr:hypothetical protein [Acidiferrobacterales bacterium]